MKPIRTLAAARNVSIFSLLISGLFTQGCTGPVPRRKSEGPGVHPGIIVLSTQQADALGIRRLGKAGEGRTALASGLPSSSQSGKEQKPEDKTLTRAPVIRSYKIARYRDPADPRVLHEAHTVYRIEEDGDWVLTTPEDKAETAQTP